MVQAIGRTFFYSKQDRKLMEGFEQRGLPCLTITIVIPATVMTIAINQARGEGMHKGGDDGGAKKCSNSRYILRKNKQDFLCTRCEEGG